MLLVVVMEELIVCIILLCRQKKNEQLQKMIFETSDVGMHHGMVRETPSYKDPLASPGGPGC